MRHPYIEQALGEASQVDDGAAVAKATVQALQRMFAELNMLLGEQAVRALYLRTLHIALPKFERGPGAAQTTLDELLTRLAQDLGHRPPQDARHCARSLLEALISLLTSLIGAPLTQRLASSAWGPAALESST